MFIRLLKSKIFALVGFAAFGVFVFSVAQLTLSVGQKQAQAETAQGRVLGENTTTQDVAKLDRISFYVPSVFHKSVEFKGDVKGLAVLKAVKVGAGISVANADTAEPTLSNSGVLSLNSKTGALTRVCCL